MAMQGSNQLSLETPKNGAGKCHCGWAGGKDTSNGEVRFHWMSLRGICLGADRSLMYSGGSGERLRSIQARAANTTSFGFGSSLFSDHRLIIVFQLLEWVLTQFDKAVNWARQGSMWPMTCKPFVRSRPRRCFAYDYGTLTSRSRLLRRRDDAHGCRSIRSGSSRCRLPSIASSIRYHDRRRNPNKQDGTRIAKGLRPGES